MRTAAIRDMLSGTRARLWGLRDASVGQVRRWGRPPGDVPRRRHPWGVNVVGYFHSTLGLAEAARSMVRMLQSCGVPVAAVSVPAAPGVRSDPGMPTVNSAAAPYAINLVYANGDGMRGILRREDPSLFAGRRTIGVWWWELIPAPASWREVSSVLDEIWVCSDHVREAIAPVADVPVVKIRQPVPVPDVAAVGRRELGLPQGTLFYFVFDYASGFERKNPLGTVAAFRQAFEDDPRAQLVIRSLNGRRDPASRRRLQRAVAAAANIRLLDRNLSLDERGAMLACADCYVSLHRAEGFGLPLAEAMRLGRPVIATGWSGNLEFMTDANSFLVDYAMKPVGRGSWPYPASAEWADPDLAHAARLMRQVFEDPAGAAAKGRRAAQDLESSHDLAPASAAAEARLMHLRSLEEVG